MTTKEVIVSAKNKNATVTIEQLALEVETGFRLERHTLTPGFIAPKHLHTDFEWIQILEGEFIDEHGKYPQGTLLINKKDSIHTPYTTIGCTLLIFTRAKRIPVKEKYEKS